MKIIIQVIAIGLGTIQTASLPAQSDIPAQSNELVKLTAHKYLQPVISAGGKVDFSMRSLPQDPNEVELVGEYSKIVEENVYFDDDRNGWYIMPKGASLLKLKATAMARKSAAANHQSASEVAQLEQEIQVLNEFSYLERKAILEDAPIARRPGGMVERNGMSFPNLDGADGHVSFEEATHATAGHEHENEALVKENSYQHGITNAQGDQFSVHDHERKDSAPGLTVPEALGGTGHIVTGAATVGDEVVDGVVDLGDSGIWEKAMEALDFLFTI